MITHFEQFHIKILNFFFKISFKNLEFKILDLVFRIFNIDNFLFIKFYCVDFYIF